MKSNIKFLVCLLVLFSFACNQDKSEKSGESIEPEVEEVITQKPNKLIFEVELTTTEPDDFRLLANEVFLNNNQFMDISITHKLNANETSKVMQFVFPENIKPDFQLGFSLGTKKTKSVEIKSINLSYGDVVYNVIPSELVKYFRTNKFIDYNEESGALTTKKIDGKHNPIIFLRKNFLTKISLAD
jgi:hypothetical protein